MIVSSSVKIASIETLQAMAAKGALIEFSFAAYTATTPIPLTHYYVEKEYTSIDEGMSEGPKGGITEVARYIEAIGAEHCVMSTDFGHYALSTPVEGLRQFIIEVFSVGRSRCLAGGTPCAGFSTGSRRSLSPKAWVTFSSVARVGLPSSDSAW